MEVMMNTRKSFSDVAEFDTFLEFIRADDAKSDDEMIHTSDEESCDEMLTDTETDNGIHVVTNLPEKMTDVASVPYELSNKPRVPDETSNIARVPDVTKIPEEILDVARFTHNITDATSNPEDSEVEYGVVKTEDLESDDVSSTKPYVNNITRTPVEGKQANVKDRSKKRSRQGAHERSVMKKRILECGFCLKRFKRIDGLRVHMKIHSVERPYVCQACGKAYKRKKILQEHNCPKDTNENSGMYSCSICEMRFHYRLTLKYHMDKHNGVRYPCTTCNKTFSAENTLKQHMKLHNSTNGNAMTYISCDICEKLLTTEANLRIHMESHTGTQEFECEICNKSFGRKADLKQHKYIHTNEKPHSCTLCPRAFRSRGEFGRHMAWHRGDLTCKYCHKKYKRKDELLRHVSKHEDELQVKSDRSLQCKYCQKFLTSERTLKMHLEDHERKAGNRNYPLKFTCKLCNTDFTTISSMYRHIRDTHGMDSDTYQTIDAADSVEDTQIPQQHKQTESCNICAKTFSSKQHLRRHIKNLHTESHKTFECDMCFKRLRSISTLKEHINYAHLKKFNFHCDQCDKKFFKSRELRRHIEMVHVTP